MTSFSNPTVHPCPGCSAFFLKSHLRTINFFGVQDWSDGKPTAWWRQEPLVRCNACAALFWLDDTVAVGTMPLMPQKMGAFTYSWLPWRRRHLPDQDARRLANRLWGDPQHIGAANFDDVVHVLSRSRGVSDQRLLWLRKRIWWELNDRYRHQCDGAPLHDVPVWPQWAERNNMQAILDMLDGGEITADQMIQRGELLRLLGRFDEAIAVLKAVPADGHTEVRAVRIERLARKKDTHVRLLSPFTL